MKTTKKVIFIVLLVLVVFSLVACNPGENKPSNSSQTNNNNKSEELNNREVSSLTPTKDIKALADLTDYSKQDTQYNKSATTYSSGTYAGKNATEQINKLTTRINQKKQDVNNWKSTSAFVKIFAMSKPDELLAQMAKAALTFEEMDKVVDYLYGSEENPDLDSYIVKSETGTWSGIFTDGKTTWRERKNSDNTNDFNAGWSFFDDWDLYDRLKDYTKSSQKGASKDLAGDNASWQYRSILKKVYEVVGLSGDAAARLSTYMLDYAVQVVETKSAGTASGAVSVAGKTISYGPFGSYCKNKPSKANSDDPFSGLGDYDTLSYLLAFCDYYGYNNKSNGSVSTDNLKKCVKLYGYYYDYNKTYYNESLKDEATYEKQLKYEKQKTYTEEEWLDYVKIQRNNYVKAYRYSEKFYEDFYDVHFGFQGVIEEKDLLVYQMDNVREKEEYKAENPGTTYTSEMRTATTKTTNIDGIKGQLAMSDWTWCYSGYDPTMKEYNAANTKYEEGKESKDSERENEGKFEFEMEQLYYINYLLTKMDKAELSGALYYQVYAYSASMVGHMDGDIKNIVYIDDGMEVGSEYTNIDSEVLEKDANNYASEKINVIYGQTYISWAGANVKTLGSNAGTQNWAQMNKEIEAAIKYDYKNMQVEKESTKWKERCERLQDLVVVRKWSCCGQKVHEATKKCPYDHARNADGSPATKDYDTEHTISLFVSDYEEVLYHVAGKATLTFSAGLKDNGYKTKNEDNSKTWTTGYYGTIVDLRADKANTKLKYNTDKPAREITISSGKTFKEEMDDENADVEDSKWWKSNKTTSEDAKFGPEEAAQIVNGTNTTYVYTYVFTGWYLDQNCKYKFDERDDVDVSLTIYAGYNLTKTVK